MTSIIGQESNQESYIVKKIGKFEIQYFFGCGHGEKKLKDSTL